MAAMLFTLTTDKDGQDSLIEAAHLRSVEGLDLNTARSEIMFLNLFCRLRRGLQIRRPS